MRNTAFNFFIVENIITEIAAVMQNALYRTVSDCFALIIDLVIK